MLLEALIDAGFEPSDEVTVETSMPAASRPDVSPLADGFTLVARSETQIGRTT